MSKNACCYVLDIGPSMGEALPDGTIPLDIAKAFIKKHCQKKMLFSKQDVVSIVLVGSEETKNSLNSQNGGYQHIQVCRPVGLLDLEIIETIESADVEVTQQDIERANNDDKPVGDLVDGIVVAMDLLDDFVKKKKYSKSIYVLTDGGSSASRSGLTDIVRALKMYGIELVIVGIDFDYKCDRLGLDCAIEGAKKEEDDEKRREADWDEAEEESGRQKKKVKIEKREDAGEEKKQEDEEADDKENINIDVKREGLTPQERKSLDRALTRGRGRDKWETERLLSTITLIAGGQVITGYTALDRLSKGLMKDIAGMTKMRGGLQIGDVKDKYRVYTYALTAQANMPSLSKMSIPAVEEGISGDVQVTMERYQFNPKRGESTAVPSDQQIKGYKYGNQLVPLDESAQQSLKMEEEKGMQVLGLVPYSSITWGDIIGTVDIVVPDPEDHGSAIAVTHLVQACIDTGKAVLIKYVKRQNANPLLGALFPMQDDDFGNYFFFVQLPFEEDIREYSFPSFARIQRQITDEQQSAANALVVAMDLMQALPNDEEYSDVDENEGDEMNDGIQKKDDPTIHTKEAFQSYDTMNPALQKFYRTVLTRALVEDAPIENDPRLEAGVSPLPDVMNHASKYLKRFKRVCPVVRAQLDEEKTAKGRKAKHWRDYFDQGFSMSKDIAKIKQEVSVPGSNHNEAKDSRMKDGSVLSGNSSSSNPVNVQRERIVVSIGTSDPVGDLRSITSRASIIGDQDSVTLAINEALNVVFALLKLGLGNEYHEKASHLLAAVRNECVICSRPNLYNSGLNAIRDEFEYDQPDFWAILAQSVDKYKPISDQEESNSEVTKEVADNYFFKPLTAGPIDQGVEEPRVIEPTPQDDGDVLDMLE